MRVKSESRNETTHNHLFRRHVRTLQRNPEQPGACCCPAGVMLQGGDDTGVDFVVAVMAAGQWLKRR